MNYKISCHLVPMMVTDLPLEGKKVEGSQKNRRWKRAPQVGSKAEETITGPINSRTGKILLDFKKGKKWEEEEEGGGGVKLQS